MTSILRLLAFGAVSVLAACASTPSQDAPGASRTVAGYEAVEDEGFLIEAVDIRSLSGDRQRTEVAYNGPDSPGTIVVDTFARKLYHVQEGGTATRYSIAVGREGLAFRGGGVIGRKQKWPSWQPTANMIRTQPDLYAEYAGGLPGGLENPLGARALYLYRGNRDTLFRIHGTIQNSTIGHATSAGCIRLYNQDAIHLYEQADAGTVVKVRSKEESVELEGPYMDDAWGLAVPETPENIARKEKDTITRAKQEADEAEAAAAASAKEAADAAAYAALTDAQKARFDEKKARKQAKADALAAKEAEKAAKKAAAAEEKRQAACKANGIAAEDCPALETISG